MKTLTPPPLDDDNTPPPPPGERQDHAGVHGESEAIDPPPWAPGLAQRHRILVDLVVLVAIFVVIIILALLLLLLLPSSAVGSGLLPPTAPPSLCPPDPNQSMSIKMSSLTLCARMPNCTTNLATAPHDTPCIIAITAIIVLPPTAAAAAWRHTTTSEVQLQG